MPPSEPSRIFISYARKDGATLAQRLQKDLREQGFNAWLDTQRIKGGATWTTDIEHALDEAEFVLALMTCGSYVSEICRAEQLRALRKGRCVIPLRVQPGADVPLHLEAKNYRDFTADNRYAQAFTELLADLHAGNGIALKPEFRETSYVTVPPLPVNFVERPEALAALRDALITDDGGRHIALTALHGMGGIGKTVLAQALCHNDVVQQAFPDGVVWITMGKESAFDAITRMREVGKALGDDLSRYENELAAKNQYRSTIRKKAALIVVDDVWRSSDLEPLRAEDSPRSRLLFTTRDASIAAAVGAREHVADLLTEEQSREVLARWSRAEITNLPSIAAKLIQECGRLPLALSMVGAMLCGRPATYWKTVLEHLRNADLDKIKAQFPDYPYTDVLRAIQVSVDSLDATSRARYVALAVLLEEMAAAPPVQQCLWGVDENQAAETAEQFVSLSLAQRDQPEGSIRLHDLQLDYVRAQHQDKNALELIQGAVRLSSHVIAKDPNQFSSQIVGRLLLYRDTSAINQFAERVAKGARLPWLRPLQPALHPPGTALVRIFEGHTRSVYGVAVSADGRLVVSASEDKLLKVWDAESGRELRCLSGHTAAVRGVAVSADGRLVVSASEDKLLKVWDVESGRELCTLLGHSAAVNGVALSLDGRRAFSASDDKTLKVWDLSKGCEVRTLCGHTDGVRGVALSGDGHQAVSASRDKTLKVWDVKTGQELRTLHGHLSAVYGVAVTHDEQIAISASRDKTLKVWDVQSGRELGILAGHSTWVFAAAVTRDAAHAISAAWDNTVRIWNLARSQESRVLQGHSNWVRGVGVTADGETAVSASEDDTLKVWDVRSGRELRTLLGHSNFVKGVAVSGNGRRAVSASFDETLKVWDVERGCELKTLRGHNTAVNAVALSEDGRVAISASNNNTLRVWDVESGRELRRLQGHSRGVRGVAVSRDGRLAVSASKDTTLKVWDVERGRELRTLEGHSDIVTAVALSRDGRLAVSASHDRTLKVWDVDRGCVLRTLNGHSAPVRGVAVSSDQRLAVSAAGDNTLKVWNLNTGETLATFTCDGSVYCCTFADPFRIILAGDACGHVHFLGLEEAKSGN